MTGISQVSMVESDILLFTLKVVSKIRGGKNYFFYRFRSIWGYVNLTGYYKYKKVHENKMYYVNMNVNIFKNVKNQMLGP